MVKPGVGEARAHTPEPRLGGAGVVFGGGGGAGLEGKGGGAGVDVGETEVLGWVLQAKRGTL